MLHSQSLKKWVMMVFVGVLVLAWGPVYAGESYLDLGSQANIMLCDGGLSFRNTPGENVTECSVELLLNPVWHVPNNMTSASELLTCIEALTEVGQEDLRLVEADMQSLMNTNVYKGLNLMWEIARSNHDQPIILPLYAEAQSILIRMFADIAHNGNIILVEMAWFDGGQAEKLYIYNMETGDLSVLGMSCG